MTLQQIRVALSFLALASCLGYFLAAMMGEVAEPRHGHNITYHLFVRLESLVLPLLAIFFLLSAWVMRTMTENGQRFAGDWERRFLVDHPLAVIVAVLLVCWAGVFVVFSNFPLSMDEFAMVFSTEVYGRWQVASTLPEWARVIEPALRPIWIRYDPDTHAWMMLYLPTFSMLRVPFYWLGAESLTSPFMAALSVWMTWVIARKLWPEDVTARAVAVLALATGAQFLMTSMTPYSMAAHLALNLLWLALYTRNSLLGWFFLPWVGAVALGLHNPVTHALFVFPFCLRILLEQPIRVTIYVGLVYLLACFYWYEALNAIPSSQSGAANTDVFGSRINWPEVASIFGRILNLCYLFSWQNPLVPVAMLLVLSHWSRLPPFGRDLFYSLALSFGFYFFFAAVGGHGWGSRYTHAALGNMALLAGMLYALKGPSVPVPPWKWVRVATLFSLIVLFPLRAWMAWDFSRPYAAAYEYMQSLSADFVVLETEGAYYSQDLVRNRAFLEDRPLILRDIFMTPEMWAFIREKGEVAVIPASRLHQFGIEPYEREDPNPVESTDSTDQGASRD